MTGFSPARGGVNARICQNGNSNEHVTQAQKQSGRFRDSTTPQENKTINNRGALLTAAGNESLVRCAKKGFPSPSDGKREWGEASSSVGIEIGTVSITDEALSLPSAFGGMISPHAHQDVGRNHQRVRASSNLSYRSPAPREGTSWLTLPTATVTSTNDLETDLERSNIERNPAARIHVERNNIERKFEQNNILGIYRRSPPSADSPTSSSARSETAPLIDGEGEREGACEGELESEGESGLNWLSGSGDRWEGSNGIGGEEGERHGSESFSRRGRPQRYLLTPSGAPVWSGQPSHGRLSKAVTASAGQPNVPGFEGLSSYREGRAREDDQGSMREKTKRSSRTACTAVSDTVAVFSTNNVPTNSTNSTAETKSRRETVGTSRANERKRSSLIGRRTFSDGSAFPIFPPGSGRSYRAERFPSSPFQRPSRAPSLQKVETEPTNTTAATTFHFAEDESNPDLDCVSLQINDDTAARLEDFDRGSTASVRAARPPIEHSSDSSKNSKVHLTFFQVFGKKKRNSRTPQTPQNTFTPTK